MKKKISIGLILVMVLSFITIPVFAKEDNFYADDELTIEKSIGKTTFAAGNNVDVSSTIDGAAFVAGKNITLSSSQDYLFAAGSNVNLEGVSTKDAFLAGSILNVQSSTIRDLYAAGQTIRIDSEISRNAYLAGETVIINSRIKGDVYVDAATIKIGKEAEITGTLKYDEDANLKIEKGANVLRKKSHKNAEVKVEVTPMSLFISKATSTLYSYAALLIIGFIILATSKTFKKIDKEDKKIGFVLKSSLIGFITLIMLPIASVLVMITVIGLPLGIIALVLYFILIYLSALGTSYYFGKWAFSKKIKNDYLLLTVSLLIYYVARLIPFIGGLISLITLIFGIGLFLILIKNNITAKK